ncbi:kinesin-like protein Klp10A-like [Trifolium pratense]|uniref:Kinesin-like protein Klp10A-like n=1 Tax=Trifolium pratense TaxID=57577 RepID=A0A2K3JVI2_TRIPR|nr:kinesin-like protein Klp10A-like [Trifolium pratense]
MPGDTRVFGDDFYPINSKLEKADVDASIKLPMNEKENSTRENNVAMIKVVIKGGF